MKVHNNLAVALVNRGQFDEALAHFRKALEIEPNYPEAHNDLGIALARRGQRDEAALHFRRALESAPDNVEARTNLGSVLAACGRVDEAREHYQKALGLAAAQNDTARADFLRARMQALRLASPAGKGPQLRP